MARRLRPAVPASAELAAAGPLASSGAAPDDAPPPPVPAQPGKPATESTTSDTTPVAEAPRSPNPTTGPDAPAAQAEPPAGDPATTDRPATAESADPAPVTDGKDDTDRPAAGGASATAVPAPAGSPATGGPEPAGTPAAVDTATPPAATAAGSTPAEGTGTPDPTPATDPSPAAGAGAADPAPAAGTGAVEPTPVAGTGGVEPAATAPTSTGKPGDTDTKIDLTPVAAAAPAGDAPTAPVAAVAPKRRSRIRVPFAHAVRRPTRQAAASAARSVGAWSRRPSGRLTLPALLLLLVVAATGTAGAVIVPAIAPDPTPVAGPGEVSPDPDLELLPTLPTTAPTTSPGAVPGLPQPTGRPADVLAGWAQQTGERIGVPAVAVQAYGYAELVVSRTTPNCRLTWTTLAAIGLVESNHGRANGASLGPDGKAMPPIIGLPLDGQGGRQRIADTDGGRLDGDPVLDRAVGPMQFIPSTWAISGVDADNDGVKDPHDIDDAALAAANYLCSNGRNLSTSQDWWNAILSYNDVRQYAQAVFDAANQYGAASRA
ncbi:lytic murein transglycosylase [Polymorphospora sp. NPDC050346]|uniref:lytic murein transglycosylase n=1 Tax=Polymorphospora sp. NPDC050346 TaxID=3155780 RepID=UPI0033E74E1A